MSLALYREFRPKTFEEVIGQNHITKTLKNQVKNNQYMMNHGKIHGLDNHFMLMRKMKLMQ